MSVESMNSNPGAISQPSTQQVQQQQVVKQSQQAVKEVSQQVQEAQKLSAEEMQALADRLNEFMSNDQRNLNFSVDKELDEVVIRVMDTETQEIIRQFPSEEAIKLSKSLEGLLGIIFNDRA